MGGTPPSPLPPPPPLNPAPVYIRVPRPLGGVIRSTKRNVQSKPISTRYALHGFYFVAYRFIAMAKTTTTETTATETTATAETVETTATAETTATETETTTTTETTETETETTETETTETETVETTATAETKPTETKPIHFRDGLYNVLMRCGCNGITARTVASNVYNKTRSITDTETRITRVSALVAKYTLKYDPTAVGQAISQLILDMTIVEKQEKAFTAVDAQAAAIRDSVLDAIEG